MWTSFFYACWLGVVKSPRRKTGRGLYLKRLWRVVLFALGCFALGGFLDDGFGDILRRGSVMGEFH